jgi:hypothetical protein
MASATFGVTLVVLIRLFNTLETSEIDTFSSAAISLREAIVFPSQKTA